MYIRIECMGDRLRNRPLQTGPYFLLLDGAHKQEGHSMEFEPPANNDILHKDCTLRVMLESILSAIPNPIVCIDLKGIVTLCNSAMRDLFPELDHDLVGESLADIIDGSQLANIVKTGQPERWQKLPIGDRMYLVNRSPLFLRGGLIGALASLHDISEMEEISSELRSVRILMEELDGIIESSFDGIYVTDGEGRTVRCNQGYQRVTGLKPEDVIGYTMQELVDKQVFDQSTTINVLATGEPCTLIQKINNEMTVMASGIPLFDNNGSIFRVVTTVRDLTELNRLRDELQTVGELKSRYEEELKELRDRLNAQGDVVVSSASMRSVVDLALRLGDVDSTVLIQGESGVGKEVVADLIHRNSSRKESPFIKINCSAIPESLLESELFGYARGAFTGASREGKAGLFEAASGGTLLLDEVGDLPLPLQVKLLRVIQEKRTRRLGENKDRDVDVRLLAATNQDLAVMVQERHFREDLYYRLNVVPIFVPPLRERKEDILFLIQSFLRKFCERHKLKRELHPSLMPVLLEYHWPGNVRELENIVERMVVTSPGEIIAAESLPTFLRGSEKHDTLLFPVEGGSLKEILDYVETQVLQYAFAQHKTTRKVAKALGIDQSSVVRKAQKLGL